LGFSGFTALCSKTDFSYFQKKETASLFKNGHFKNVLFQKTATQIYITVFGGNYNCGNIDIDYMFTNWGHQNPMQTYHHHLP
jgi:hypothetical protein